MEEQKKQEKKEKLRCSKCNSTFIYVRIKDNEVVCRSCSHVEKIDGDEK